MIHNVRIHVEKEQPLLADLFALPAASDAGLVCTNVRTLDGKRPVFIDDSSSTFLFPYHVVRFLEIPEGAVKAQGRRPEPASQAAEPAEGGPVPVERSGDEAAPGLPAPVAAGADDEPDGDQELDLEIDEGFLQRVRDI